MIDAWDSPEHDQERWGVLPKHSISTLYGNFDLSAVSAVKSANEDGSTLCSKTLSIHIVDKAMR